MPVASSEGNLDLKNNTHNIDQYVPIEITKEEQVDLINDNEDIDIIIDILKEN